MKKKKIIYNFCYLKIRPTGNNTFVTLTDPDGNVILKSSAGVIKFSGKKKGTPFVAENIVKNLILTLRSKNIQINLLILQLYGFIKNYSFKKTLHILDELKVNVAIAAYNPFKYGHNGMHLKKPKRL